MATWSLCGLPPSAPPWFGFIATDPGCPAGQQHLEVGSDLAGLLQRGRPVDLQALPVIGAVVALDKSVLIGPTRWVDLDGHAQAGQEADQRRGEVAGARGADEARIAIEGDLQRPPMSLK